MFEMFQSISLKIIETPEWYICNTYLKSGSIVCDMLFFIEQSVWQQQHTEEEKEKSNRDCEAAE